MKKLILLTLITFSFSSMLKSQEIDTLIDVGKYKLHFNIIKGSGTPILFEAGGGDNGTVWNTVAKHVAAITGAPVITYDRYGFGQSSKDTSQISIQKEIEALKNGLTKLRLDNGIMLVGHSMGGFYNLLFTTSYPKEVKAVVFIDANLPSFFTEDQLKKMDASSNFRSTIALVKTKEFPTNIPLVDIVSERTLFRGTSDADRWKQCHKEFVAMSPERKEIIAYETGHYIFYSNRQLVINAVVTQYANKVSPSQKELILERGYAQELIAANEDRKELMKYWHSENDLNEWGYSFLQQGEMQKALEVFKLNVLLHPESPNVFDSLGEAYLKNGDKDHAITNYRKSLELNPKNENARKVLNGLVK